ncbi:hypothetical protein Q8A67_020486 [Cirrhinus molitorella]|uniref:Uncharacterized protein n=1 Tax=Cirrhinus molitorella TaxID=172907 RepID=A0AA88PAE5_9TELE|nr:hypothetical protein Q8A67_020486 [Cirrhinus molitorella]
MTSQVQDVVVAGSQSSNFLLPKENSGKASRDSQWWAYTPAGRPAKQRLESMELLGPELGFSPSLCLRHVGGGFLTHGSRSHRTMKVLSVCAPLLRRYECDVTAHEPTHSSQAKSQTHIHRQSRRTELALINTCFHEHVPPRPG